MPREHQSQGRAFANLRANEERVAGVTDEWGGRRALEERSQLANRLYQLNKTAEEGGATEDNLTLGQDYLFAD